MLKNIGKSDKLIRIAVAILLLAIVQFLGITGTLSVILMGLSLVFFSHSIYKFMSFISSFWNKYV